MRGVRPWRSSVFRLLFAAAEGFLIVCSGSVMTALLIWKAGLPSAVILRTVSEILWGMGAFFAGRRSGLHGRRQGAAEGALCGAILFLIWLCGVVIFKEAPKSMLLQGIMMPLTGAAGGILGVNTRLKKPPD
ncbi:MAG: TIGR04086 family membrane protein [Oscillospiraceae bacterium]|nr:TIGR04086 family membrane protein [Oscillospiraceae bacterium]